MAIFRAGKRVGPFDIRVGFPRDRSYDRIDYPANYTRANTDNTIGRFRAMMGRAEGYARPSRFVGGERIDAAISELDIEKRKVNLSIKLLEEIQNKEAVNKFSSPLSGKNLPFSSLSDKLEKNKK